MSDPDITDRLATYFEGKWNQPVEIAGFKRFHGGAGRETYRFDVASGDRREGLVLRRDPPKSIIETDRLPEYRAIEMFHGTDVPVPEPLFLEEGADAFGAPGFIMREVPDCDAVGAFEADPFGEARAQIGQDFFGALGAIHSADPASLGLPVSSAKDRLKHWAGVIAEDSVQPEPVAAAARRWLLANLPPDPKRACVVHGDYRRGNFLVRDGRIAAILDWEMVHVGDPLEDLAWASDPLWSFGSDYVAATVPQAEAIRIWEKASGLTCDAHAFRWWQMFAQYMGLAIWISAAAEIASGRSVDPVVAWAGLHPYREHNAGLARALKEAAQ
ncbi:MAG: phosphotransferase family protein [Pacificimonas sp.]